MPQNSTLYILLLSTSLSYLVSVSAYSHFVPQIIALTIILAFVFRRLHLSIIPPVSLVCNLIVFTTGGLSSPFYFLIYFLLFTTAFSISPISSLIFSLISILLLGQTLTNPTALLSLVSLLFITPLVWLISRETIAVARSANTIATDETDFLLWINLKFKTGITTIIDLASQLQSTTLNYTQKEQLKKIRSSAKSLLNSSAKLTTEISNDDEEV
jgi:hypothetical protein